MSGQSGLERCHWCGHPLTNGVCPHCDRRPEGWTDRAAVRLHQYRSAGLRLTVLLAVVLSVFALTRAWPRPGGRPAVGTLPPAASSTTASNQRTAPVRPASTFVVRGAERDELGQWSRLGYAFVIRSSGGTSDLLTDYDLVVERFLRGDRSVDLARGDATFTATIVAVSPDPHVALLRISGTFPALPIASRPPEIGATVVLGEDATTPAPRAAVVADPGRGRRHLTFSVAVDAGDDGTPLLDLSGHVVGIAEPGAPYGAADVGHAIPIRSGCLAVRAC